MGAVEVEIKDIEGYNLFADYNPRSNVYLVNILHVTGVSIAQLTLQAHEVESWYHNLGAALMDAEFLE